MRPILRIYYPDAYYFRGLEKIKLSKKQRIYSKRIKPIIESFNLNKYRYNEEYKKIPDLAEETFKRWYPNLAVFHEVTVAEFMKYEDKYWGLDD